MPYVLTRGSRPEASLIPYADFLRYQQLQERDVMKRVDVLLACLPQQNAAFDEAEGAADVAVAVAKARSDDGND